MFEFYIEDKIGRRLVIEQRWSWGYEDAPPAISWARYGDQGTPISTRRSAEQVLELLNPVHVPRIVEITVQLDPEPEAKTQGKSPVTRYFKTKSPVICPECGHEKSKILTKSGHRRWHECKKCGLKYWSVES